MPVVNISGTAKLIRRNLPTPVEGKLFYKGEEVAHLDETPQGTVLKVTSDKVMLKTPVTIACCTT